MSKRGLIILGKNLSFLLVFISLMSLSGAVYVGSEEELGPGLLLRQVEYSPFPVEPGDTFEITFTIKNTDLRRTINNLRFTMDESYPFSIAEGEQRLKSLPKLDPSERAFISFKVKVDEKAAVGENEISLVYQEEVDGPLRTSQPFKIGIETTTQTLSVTEIETNPGVLQPGSEALLFLTIKNTGGFLMRDIDVNIDLVSEDLPFVPLGSSTTQRIDYVNPGGASRLTFKVLVNANAESKAYKIPLKIDFADEIGQTYEIDDLIGLQVSAEPDYLVSVDESTVLQKGVSSDLLITISNIGPADLKFLIVKLEESDKYEILSNSITYLGNLDSDDFETAEFQLLPKTRKSNIDLGITVEFKDAFNKVYTEKHNLPLNIYSKREAQSLGLVTASGGSSPLIYLILIVLIYITFREWRKTKDLPTALKLTLKKVLIFIGTIIKLIIRPRYLKKTFQRFIEFVKQ